MEKSIKRNAVLNVCKTLTTTLFPVLTYMYVSRIFGAEGYGKISFSNSIIQYFVLASMLGITNYATSEAAKVRDDKEKLNRLVSEIISINVISMAVSYALLFLSLNTLSRLDEYRCFILVYSIGIVLRMIGMEWLYSAMEDYLYITVRTMIVQAASLICVFAFVHTRDDLIKYSFIQVAAVGGANIFNLFHSRKYIVLRRVRAASVKKHLKPIMTLFLMTLFINLFTQIDSTMVGLIQNDNAVGLYAAGDKMSSMVSGVIGAVSMVMLPRIAFYFKNGLNKELMDVIVKVVNVILLIAIPSALGICLLSRPIILLFSGASFSAAAVTVKILSLRVLLSPLNAVFVLHVFIPLNRERSSMLVTAVAAAANFAVNLFLIPTMSYNGAAVATVMSEAVEFVLVIIMAGRFLPMGRIFSRLWQYLAASAGILAVWLLVSRLTEDDALIMILVIMGSAAVYFAILLLLKNEYVVYAATYVRDKVRLRKR